MDGWINRLFRKERKVRTCPADQVQYIVDKRVIRFTEKILRIYGQDESEGLVYWAGTREGDRLIIDTAFAPKVEATRYGFHTTHLTNGHYVETINEMDRVHIAQVHSHPGSWVDHSYTDDEETAFRKTGLVSVVVPRFGSKSMVPFKRCGIHRYDNDKFERLSDGYVSAHFKEQLLNHHFLKDYSHGYPTE